MMKDVALESTYAELPERFYTRMAPTPVAQPRLIALNDALAGELGLDPALLASEAGRIVSRRRLLRELWGFPDPDRVETRTVDTHIKRLREKLGEMGREIETVRGVGYRLRRPTDV